MPALNLPRVKQAQAISGDTLINLPAAALEALVNGTLDDANLAANAPVKLVTTLAGEPARAGATRLLQAGSSRLLVTYDATIGKYVSDPQFFVSQHEATSTISASPVAMSAAVMPKVFIPDFKAFYDAGLRPMVAGISKIDPSGAVTGSIRVEFFEFAANDTVGSSVGVGPALTHNTDTATYKSVDWSFVAISPAPTDAHAYMEVQISVTSTGCGFSDSYFEMRWRQN